MADGRRSTIPGTARAFLANDRGGIAALTAILLPVLIGFAALGVSVGMWLDAKRDLQTQADAGALAGKSEVLNGSAAAARNRAIQTGVTGNGYAAATCPSTACTVNYPVTGPGGDTQAVQVRLTRQQPLFFAAIYPGLSVTVGARATAEAVKLGDACILALDPDNVGNGVRFWGSGDIRADNCIVAANEVAAGAVAAGGNANVYAQSVYTSGGYTESGSADMISNFRSPPITGATALPDPYATLGSTDTTLNTIHTSGATCTGANTNVTVGPSATRTLAPGIYCGNMRLQGTVTFSPGVFYLYQGNLTVNSTATVNGTGVTIVMTTRSSQPTQIGGVTINGGARINLTAPPLSASTPPASLYKGVVFYYDRLATGNPTLTFNGGDRMNFTGAVYAPTATLDFLGNNGTTASTCMKLVAFNIVFTGNTATKVDTSGCASVLGTTGDTSVYEVRLTQ